MVLPEPVLPMIAVVSPGGDLERDVAEHRVLGARVLELDVAELERAVASASSVTGFGGTIDDVGVEHLLDPLRAHRRRGAS